MIGTQNANPCERALCEAKLPQRTGWQFCTRLNIFLMCWGEECLYVFVYPCAYFVTMLIWCVCMWRIKDSLKVSSLRSYLPGGILLFCFRKCQLLRVLFISIFLQENHSLVCSFVFKAGSCSLGWPGTWTHCVAGPWTLDPLCLVHLVPKVEPRTLIHTRQDSTTLSYKPSFRSFINLYHVYDCFKHFTNA